MITSKTCELAIRALILIAQDKSGKPIRISKLHDELNIGFSFMTKILQPLTQAGILSSFKGAKGGIMLNRLAIDISVKDVVLSIDGNYIFTSCALGFPKCGEPNYCEFHDKWWPLRQQLTQTFEQTSIAELANSSKSIII
jgi:Rrf2 family transcriptional regulator, iron-sulfur cluster assembly transcription factor